MYTGQLIQLPETILAENNLDLFMLSQKKSALLFEASKEI
ncbi:hypothetical protein IGI37_002219 [Enterococcus sp. AZ194]